MFRTSALVNVWEDVSLRHLEDALGLGVIRLQKVRKLAHMSGAVWLKGQGKGDQGRRTALLRASRPFYHAARRQSLSHYGHSANEPFSQTRNSRWYSMVQCS